MRSGIKQANTAALIIILFLLGSGQAAAQKKVLLATAEHRPYISNTLPNQGYVHELVTKAFKRAGYKTEIIFYSSARAKRLAEGGHVDGFLPSYYEKSLKDRLYFQLLFQELILVY